VGEIIRTKEVRMRVILNMGLGLLFAASVAMPPAFAADQKVTLMLGGKHCDSYLNDVETALKTVPGVKSVDLKSMPGHAVIETDGGKAKPQDLEAAVNGVKGSGWNCTGKVMK
jgi:copper chaperone CopZ